VNKISYANVQRAISFYTFCGFTYVEVPWIVTDEAVNVTLPLDVEAFRCQAGPLVGSAEQSFIQMALDGDLTSGRYVGASPCFRQEKVLDRLHQQTFFKVELIELSMLPIPNARHHVEALAELAQRFFESIPGCSDTQIVDVPGGFDIEHRGVELGSYGYRSHRDFHWIYGTGYADPRFRSTISG
jgi:seryl-tRNA synthetase